MIIDSHLHIWTNDVKKYPWNPIGGYIPEKSFPIEHFIKEMDNAGVDKAVIVQPTPYGWDNSYLMDTCCEEENRFRAVVLVNPLSISAGEDLRFLHKQGAKGLRINLNLLENDVLASDTLLDLISTACSLRVPVCFQLTPIHFELVGDWAKQFKEIPFILDHLCRLNKGTQTTDLIFKDFLELSNFKNVFVKLSGLNYFSSEIAPYKDTWLLLTAACKEFGVDHCLWGSDYPFVNDHWSYGENLNTYQNDLGFSSSDLEWILGKTAASIWWGD